MIKAVIFDVDGVLIDSYEANFAFYRSLMERAGYEPFDRERFGPLFHLSLMDAIRIMTNADEDEVKRIFELAKRPEVEYPVDLIETPKGIEAVLDSLSKEYVLGIVTSRIAESVFEASKLGKFEGCFKAVVSYEDTVKHKPDSEPLLLAAEKLRVDPSECVYVGDVETDVMAAKGSGMRVIIYSKRFIKSADVCISDFSTLPEAVKSMDRLN